MKYLPLVLLLLATPVRAADVTITFNDQDKRAFLAVLDAALKCGGVNALNYVNQLMAKYQAAEMPKPETPKK